MAVGVARVAGEVLLVVAKRADGLLLLGCMTVLAAADLTVLVCCAWQGRDSSRGHVRSGDKVLRKDEGVRTDTQWLEVLAAVGHDIHSVPILGVGLPRNHALLLVLHAFLDCSRLAAWVLDDGLVDGCHLLLRRETSP